MCLQSPERKSLLSQKKDTSVLNVAKHMALGQRIAELLYEESQKHPVLEFMQKPQEKSVRQKTEQQEER